MTTGMNFKERAREAAENWSGDPRDDSDTFLSFHSFLAGAEWGYLQAIEELRSEDAAAVFPVITNQYGHRRLTPRDWADWLEKRMEEKNG